MAFPSSVPRRILLLCSGGIESLVTMAMARSANPDSRFHALFINYGQRTVDKEWRAATRMSRHYGVFLEDASVEIPSLDDHSLVDKGIEVFYSEKRARKLGKRVRMGSTVTPVVPYRNAVFLSMAAVHASVLNVNELWVGFDPKTATHAGDKSLGFLTAFQKMIEIGAHLRTDKTINPVFRVVAPLIDVGHKAETIRFGVQFGVDFSMSWSCYNNFPKPCGVCGACDQRSTGFKKAGVRSPDKFMPIDEMIPE